ncbi:MAG: hypothetical protein H0W05_05720 [Thermoleophilaceae bacterium]|jgi:uncharacterized membrane protein YeaQ/YmgE (transglycosylase-associated protein family)|nr:hypothetical protein [Thermoleophilaceae bacterium]MBA2567199.1 hypothetical protein [Thermoleophilaceae bacterium]
MIGFIVFGLIVGLLARLVLPGRQPIGILKTLLVGVIGSVIGGIIANLIGSGDIFELNFFGAVVAILAAVGLLIAGQKAGLLEGDERDQLQRRH